MDTIEQTNHNMMLESNLNVNISNDQITNHNIRQILQVIISVVLCGIISVFGTVANIINMAVFYKQGLNTTINISFFSLAVSDLGSVIFQQFYNIFENPLFQNSDLTVDAIELQYAMAGMPRESFSRITCLITVYIAAERWLCIAFPLHVKQIITPRRASIIMVCIYSLTLLSVLPLWYTTYIDWKFYPNLNKTLLGLSFTNDREHVEGIVLIVHAIMGTLSFAAVVIFTMILIRKLNQKSTWRKTVCMESQQVSKTNKDKQTIKTVVLIATILIICYIPSAVLFLTTFFVPDFSVSGRFTGLFMTAWSFGFLFETINSSVNIFLYWSMSSKYRATFRAILSKCATIINSR